VIIRKAPIPQRGVRAYAVSNTSGAKGVAVETLLKNFVRDGEGRWTCFEHAELDTPAGRIEVTPGTTFIRGIKFMNCDVAALLDEQATNDTHPS